MTPRGTLQGFHGFALESEVPDGDMRRVQEAGAENEPEAAHGDPLRGEAVPLRLLRQGSDQCIGVCGCVSSVTDLHLYVDESKSLVRCW